MVNQSYINYTFRAGMMTCGVKLVSKSKGKGCNDYSYCDVTLNGVAQSGRKADCGCFYDGTGYAVCGPMNGDSEFDDYRAAFVVYFQKTKYCHVARGFDYECGAKAEFYKLYRPMN